MGSKRGVPGRQGRAIYAHMCILASVSPLEDLSLHVLDEGAGASSRLGTGVSLGGMRDLLITNQLHVFASISWHDHMCTLN